MPADTRILRLWRFITTQREILESHSCLPIYDGSFCYRSTPEKKILVCGDGDLSYSASKASDLMLNGIHLVATVLETEKQHLSIYKDSSKNVDKIRQYGHEVKFEVDALKLSDHFSTCALFDRIQWNFPHWKGRTNTKKNRSLITEFFSSCRTVLDDRHGQVHLALLDHQGGAYSSNMEAWKQSWMPARYAAEHAGLLLTHVMRFQPDYTLSSYQWRDKPFLSKGKKQMYIFSVANQSLLAPDVLQLYSYFFLCVPVNGYTQVTAAKICDLVRIHVPDGIRVQVSWQKLVEGTGMNGNLVYTRYLIHLFGERFPMTQLLAENTRKIIDAEMKNMYGTQHWNSTWNASNVYPSSLLLEP